MARLLPAGGHALQPGLVGAERRLAEARGLPGAGRALWLAAGRAAGSATAERARNAPDLSTGRYRSDRADDRGRVLPERLPRRAAAGPADRRPRRGPHHPPLAEPRRD